MGSNDSDVSEVSSGFLCQRKCRLIIKTLAVQKSSHIHVRCRVWLGSATEKSRDDGEEGGRTKPRSWAKKYVENSRQRHRKTGKAGSGPLGRSEAQ